MKKGKLKFASIDYNFTNIINNIKANDYVLRTIYTYEEIGIKGRKIKVNLS